MEVKIKQGNEMLDATIEMVDGVMVVSPNVEKFEPKDGDVCKSLSCIYIFKSTKPSQTINGEQAIVYHLCYDIKDNGLFVGEDVGVGYISKDNRLATEEEKQNLFDRLAEEGYEFDFDKKELVKLKWSPKEGEEFWLPLYYASPSEFEPIKSLLNKGRDKAILDKGWFFKTKEECQEFCNRLNDAINSVKP